MATAPARADSIPLRLALAGFANCCAATATNPLDVLKVRMQTDGSPRRLLGPAAGAPRAPGLLQTLVALLRDEGVRGLYRGLAPSLLREASYSSLRLGLYEPFRDAAAAALPASAGGGGGSGGSSLAVKLAAGAASGVVGSALANPADLLKVRLQLAQRPGGGGGGGGAPPQTLLGAAASVVLDRGVVGLWRGVGPSMARAGCLTASQVGSYDHIKQWLRTWGGPALADEGLPLHAACAVAAGFVASVATTPIDFVKTRLMAAGGGGGGAAAAAAAHGAPHHAASSSAWHCVAHALRTEGAGALYAGFLPTFLRLGPHTVITMVVFERARAACGIVPV